DLNVAVDTIGPPVDLAGLCQGGWLSLLYAARFPDKVRRLVLAGSPVDVSV
ncbi:alpha/beta hydrolase, partial [Salmonella enterica subsp. enterica serovar Enteritidis]